MFYPYLYFDPTMLLLIPVLVFSIYAQSKISSSYHRYAKILSQKGIPAHHVVQAILQKSGISDVAVEQTGGTLTDHFDPRKKVIRLSSGVYQSSSIAAIAVAAHETGHAIQAHEHYGPMKFRNVLAPITSIGARLAIPLILIGLIFQWMTLMKVAIVFFFIVFVFQLITLPVEYNASHRALIALEQTGILNGQELPMAKKVLSAAALTYVAAAMTALVQLLRFILLARRRER